MGRFKIETGCLHIEMTVSKLKQVIRVLKRLVPYGNGWFRIEMVGSVWKRVFAYRNDRFKTEMRCLRMEMVGSVWKWLVPYGNGYLRMKTAFSN
jgi:hypothetical protein